MDINYSVSFGDSQQRLTQEKRGHSAALTFCHPPMAQSYQENDDDRRQLVRRDVAAVLDQSRAFSTLSEHALAAGALVPELAGHSGARPASTSTDG